MKKMIDFQYNANARRYKAISLFAGAGGCSLGFSKYGIEILGAYDIWKVAVDTYNNNFKGNKAHLTDLANCDFEEMRDGLGLKRGELDIIIGGPPCQGYTTAGKREGDDPRNQLFKNYGRALSSFFPRWFMLENVEGMLTTGKGAFVIDCVNMMIRLGYTVCIKKVYMQEYGVPQRRKRVIIIGNREGKRFCFPKVSTHANGFRFKDSEFTLRDAIGDLEGHDNVGINHIRKKETGIKLQRIEAIGQGGTMRDLPVELQHKSFARRANRRVCDGIPSEKRGGAPSGLKRLVYDEPSLTITGSSTNEFIHPTENRMLTVRECARIQTFPDSFVFSGTDSQQEQQIGNAIPPLFANIIAKQIVECDNCKSIGLPRGLLFYDLSKSTTKSPALESTCTKLDTYLINIFSYETAANRIL